MHIFMYNISNICKYLKNCTLQYFILQCFLQIMYFVIFHFTMFSSNNFYKIQADLYTKPS